MKMIKGFAYFSFVALFTGSSHTQDLPELIDTRTDGTAIFSCAGILRAAANIKDLSQSDYKRVFDAYQRNDIAKQTLYKAMQKSSDAGNIGTIWPNLRHIELATRTKALTFIENGRKDNVVAAAAICMRN
jgi:hypothetical protein